MTPLSPSDERYAHARDAFAQWASSQRGAPRDAAALVQDVEVSDEHVGLLTSEIQGRRVAWKSVPFAGVARATAPPIPIERLDPWSMEPAQLRERSDHVVTCESCGGSKRGPCNACRGVGAVLCTACGGQRKVYGYAANGSRRWLNCTSCKGKGQVDCAYCRRGIATCATCAGEGRLQRWIEVDTWHRTTANVHPEALARKLRWSPDAANYAIAADAEVVADIDRSHQLTTPDLGGVPPDWLHALSPRLQPGERIARQRLRVARVPVYTVWYCLAGEDDRIAFTGRRFVPAAHDASSALARRARRLRALRWSLLAAGFIILLLVLGRGAFYWSVLSLLSLIAFAGMLASIQGAVAARIDQRPDASRWLAAAFAFFIIALALTFAAMPRLAHAERLTAAGNLERAERELDALGDAATAKTWADLRVAQIARATELEQARETLALIPRQLPQHAAALAALDRFLVRTAAEQVREHRWSAAGETLGSLTTVPSEARELYLEIARSAVVQKDWERAADAIAGARRARIADVDLAPLVEAIHNAAADAAADANREEDARRRLSARVLAEKIYVAWERATDQWGTPPLIALRTAMARDVAAAERAARRRAS